MRLKDKTAIVTGAAQGIGLGCATRFAAEGAGVALFLASDDAAYVTGQVIYVEGGRSGLNYTM